MNVKQAEESRKSHIDKQSKAIRELRQGGKAVELTRAELDLAIDLMVEMFLAFRAQYFKVHGMKHAITHWERIKNLMKKWAPKSETVGEWATGITRDLQLQTLGKRGCSTLLEVSETVRDLDLWRVVRRALVHESGSIECFARAIAGARADEKELREAEGVTQ